MTEEKKKNPQKGDFIDLEKTDFKKKSNLFGSSIKYILLGFIFFGLGLFVSQKYTIPLDLDLSNGFSQKQSNDPFPELKSNIDSLKNDIEEVSKKIRESNLSYENLEIKNRKLILKLDEISEKVSTVDEFDYTESFSNELNQYKLLKNFIILKNKFNNRQALENEISIISTFFEDNFEVISILNFFSKTNLPNIVKKDYLLGEINEKIKKYDLQLEDFFEEVKNEENSERKNIFESKEKLFSYINDIFSSTFKITKYEDKNFEENIRERGNYKKVLALSKEYLIIGNVTKALQIIEESGIDLNDYEEWLEKGNKLVEAKNKIEELEELILKRLVSYND